MAVIAVGVGGVFAFRLSGPAAPTAAALVEQMERAVEGDVPSTHALGGPLRVAMNGGKATVTAENVPAKACVLAGWPLSRKGIVAINGTMPARVSATILATLCNRDGDAATLSWTPRD